MYYDLHLYEYVVRVPDAMSVTCYSYTLSQNVLLMC